MPSPVVTSVKESQAVGPDRRLKSVVVVSYMVGNDGPFTLTTTQAELANGIAQQQMNAFAATLSSLPRS
jgi:hypothetical protein